MPQPIITLLTDFGLSDSYVGVMKGVMLQINPNLKFVDITHEIPQGDIKRTAFRLFTAYKYFPKQTIHLVVVDPGVGTKRHPIIVETPDYYFVGPDNGIFSWIYSEENFKVYKINVNQLMAVNGQQTISNTFHGRDIFAPTSARLSLGTGPEAMGKQLSKWVAFKLPTPVRKIGTRHGMFLQGKVIDIDRFGNLITNISRTQCRNTIYRVPCGSEVTSPLHKFEIKIGNYVIRKLKTSYEGTSPIAIFGSSGFLEISLSNGNCANFLHAKPETKITIRISK